MAKFILALSALVMIAGCSCNKDQGTTDATTAPATGDAAATMTPADAGAAAPTDAAATATATPEATASPAAH